MRKDFRIPAIVILAGALLGLVFATYSSLDYAAHLDRQLHDVHCSVIPGAPPQGEEGAQGCRAAMYSAYSAVLKGKLWGGIPISLFAQGCYAFFAGFAVFLLVAGRRASRSAAEFVGVVGLTPVLVSVVMAVISITQLGTFCHTCIGMYLASLLVAVGGIMTLWGASARSRGGVLLPIVWLGSLGVCTAAPAAAYAAVAPDHTPYLSSCGGLKLAEPPPGVLVSLPGNRPLQPALMFEDPLCANCKAVHLRLVQEGIIEKLDTRLALLPLDSACNWMLDTPLHPGACSVSKAVICAGPNAREVLEWAFDQQHYLLRAGERDQQQGYKDQRTTREVIRLRWGDELGKCVGSKEAEQRLNRHLQFAVDNTVPVSTPQLYLSGRRVCDEDTDLGLRFALTRTAPELVR